MTNNKRVYTHKPQALDLLAGDATPPLSKAVRDRFVLCKRGAGEIRVSWLQRRRRLYIEYRDHSGKFVIGGEMRPGELLRLGILLAEIKEDLELMDDMAKDAQTG